MRGIVLTKVDGKDRYKAIGIPNCPEGKLKDWKIFCKQKNLRIVEVFENGMEGL